MATRKSPRFQSKKGAYPDFIDPSAPKLYRDSDDTTTSESSASQLRDPVTTPDAIDDQNDNEGQQSNSILARNEYMYPNLEGEVGNDESSSSDSDETESALSEQDIIESDEQDEADEQESNHDENHDENEDVEATRGSMRMTRSRAARVTSNRQGVTSYMRRSIPQNRYRSYPGLAEFFKPVLRDGNKVASVCRLCKTKINHHANSRLFNHLLKSCKDIGEAKRNVVERMLNKGSDDSRFNFVLAKVIVKNNLPIRLVECPLFRRLCHMTPPINFPSRHRISSFHIPTLSSQVEKKFFEEVSRGPNYCLSTEFDHWTDSTHRSLLAVLVTKENGARYLLDVEDVSTVGHSADSIVETLNRVLEPIEPQKINSIISDAAASCAKARGDFVMQPRYRHVVQHRCTAHLLNLIGKGVTEDPEVALIMKQASMLVSVLSSDVRIMAEFTRAGTSRCRRYIKTRWYSTISMIESLINCQDLATRELATAINNGRSGQNPERMASLEVLQSDLFGPNLRILASIFRPLANCIAISERASSYLGESMCSILEFAKSLFDSDWEVSFVIPTIESFLIHFNATKLSKTCLGLMIAAYFLDRRNIANYVTRRGVFATLKVLYDLALSMGYLHATLQRTLPAELYSFWKREGTFARKIEQEQSARDWWLKQPDAGVLKGLALRIVSLRSSSANIERLFSTMKSIQVPNRHRFALTTMTRMARTRISNDWYDDPEDEFDDEFEYEMLSLEQRRRSQTQKGPTRDSQSFRVELEAGADAFARNLASTGVGAIDSEDETVTSAASSSQTGPSPPRKKIGFASSRAAPHHLPNRLKRECRAAYREFFKIIDFNITNTEHTQEQAEEERPHHAFSSLLSTFKNIIKN